MPQAARARGYAIVAALAMVAISATLAWVFLNFSQSSSTSSFRIASDIRAFHLAEAGIRYELSTAGEGWAEPRESRIHLATGETHVKVERAAGDTVILRSTGISGSVHNSIVMVYTADGHPLRRFEESHAASDP